MKLYDQNGNECQMTGLPHMFYDKVAADDLLRLKDARIAELEKALQAISIVEFNGSCCGCSGDWSLDECHRLAKEALGL